MKPLRLIVIALITASVCLVTAGIIWKMGLYRDRMDNKPTFCGTKIVPASSLNANQPDVYEMQGISASKPLDELLPNGWKDAKRRIVVEKSKRLLSVYSGDKLIKTYFMSLGFRPTGPKEKRDDGKTPEGVYYVCSKNPKSSYELSLLISYPSIKEAKSGLDESLIDKTTCNRITESIENGTTPPQDTNLGSAICIHGGGIGELADDLSKARISDWTAGCMALRSEDIKDVYDFAEPGTRVVIKP